VIQSSHRPFLRRPPLLIAGILCVASLVAIAGAQVGDRSAIDTAPPPADWRIPATPVRTPEESMRLMDLPPGFRIEVAAAEPLVQDPIAITFDARGRLWVLEWPTYNWELRTNLPGTDARPRPASRVVLLEDTGGDGRMDRRTVFAELEWPRGFQVVGDGLLVFALPDVLFLRDTNGDGRADTREVVVGGLPIPANPHAAPSSPLLAMDNWIHALQIDKRLRLRGGRWQVVAGSPLPGQWGLTQDDYGRLFFSYNQDHLRGSLVPVQYADRNPNYAATAGIDERIGVDQEVWPHAMTPGVNRRAHLGDDGRLRMFTANAAPSVYRARLFPDEFHGNVFVGESAGRLVRRTVLSEADGIITGRNAYDKREFLFSHDERFRPVFTALGPEGALYIADMYRGIIEGHIFITTFLRGQFVDRHLYEPFHGMGRIYRIVYEGRATNDRPEVTPANAAGWVAHLAHVNGFWRDTAQRSIVAAADPSVLPAVRTLALGHADARTRLHALWTISGLRGVDEPLVRALLQDGSPHVRAAALRLAEPLLENASMLQTVLAAADDREAIVRRQLVYSLGASRAPEAERSILQIVGRHGDEPFMVDAALSGLGGRESAVLKTIVGDPAWADDRPGNRRLVAALSAAIVNEGQADRVDDLLRLAANDAIVPSWRRIAVLQGVKSSRRKELSPLPPSLSLLRDVQDPLLRESARQVVDRYTTGQPAAKPGARAPDAATMARIEEGRAAYAVCAACHQNDGRGLPSIAPALAGAATVIGSPDALIDIVLRGRDVDPAFPSMPPLAGLPDDQLAAILTYVRQAWGNDATAVGPDAIRARRLP
jgi:mono/diheme cytochrome c family protein/glucose/arabinose dehydrogenase